MIKCLLEKFGVQGSTLGVPTWYAVRTDPKGYTFGVLDEYVRISYGPCGAISRSGYLMSLYCMEFCWVSDNYVFRFRKSKWDFGKAHVRVWAQ